MKKLWTNKIYVRLNLVKYKLHHTNRIPKQSIRNNVHQHTQCKYSQLIDLSLIACLDAVITPLTRSEFNSCLLILKHLFWREFSNHEQYPKTLENVLSDALLMPNFQNFAASAGNNKTVFENPRFGWLNQIINKLLKVFGAKRFENLFSSPLHPLYPLLWCTTLYPLMHYTTSFAHRRTHYSPLMHHATSSAYSTSCSLMHYTTSSKALHYILRTSRV